MDVLYIKYFFTSGVSLFNLHKYIKYFPQKISGFNDTVRSFGAFLTNLYLESGWLSSETGKHKLALRGKYVVYTSYLNS